MLYGACDPAVRTPYQPLVEALEPALAGLEADEPGGAGRYPASLTRLLPGLRAEAGDPRLRRRAPRTPMPSATSCT